MTARINKDYTNSSKPSSQSPGHRAIPNGREKSGRKPGGQKGHIHHERKRLKPTEVISIPAPSIYKDDPNFKETGNTVRKQLVKLHVGVEVVEYNTPEFRNQTTGQRVHAAFPEGLKCKTPQSVSASQAQVERAGSGYIFYIQGKKKQRKIPLNRLSRGYKDFEKTLELTGVLHRIGAKTQEKFKRDAEKVFVQYQNYRDTYLNSVQPKPEGDCVVCPDCQGKGLHLKKLPLLKVDVGKVCKTCGGSGYLSR